MGSWGLKERYDFYGNQFSLDKAQIAGPNFSSLKDVVRSIRSDSKWVMSCFTSLSVMNNHCYGDVVLYRLQKYE
jgi:hypothetical protein